MYNKCYGIVCNKMETIFILKSHMGPSNGGGGGAIYYITTSLACYVLCKCLFTLLCESQLGWCAEI